MTLSQRFFQAIGRLADVFQVIGYQGIIAMIGSFALPAWTVWYADLFAKASPASWVIAGFIGTLTFVLLRLLWHVGTSVKARALFNARALERGSQINPLDLTFERKRIFLDELVLPSHTIIANKTFIDCQLIGPAVLYFA